MRYALVLAAVLTASAFTAPAHADPYRWCAQYNTGSGENCYFRTFEQCRAQISGVGGFCRMNGFYDGGRQGGGDFAPRRRGYNY